MSFTYQNKNKWPYQHVSGNIWFVRYRWQNAWCCFNTFLFVLCEMFLITSIMTDEQVEEDPLHGFHTHQIWILWIFTCWDTWNSLCMQLTLIAKRHFTITLWMPIRVPTTTPVSFNKCSGPWCGMSRCVLTLVENFLSTYYKCTLSAVVHNWNVSRHVLIRTFFMCWYVELVPKVCTFQLHPIYVITDYRIVYCCFK
jgi:hypothetical protein